MVKRFIKSAFPWTPCWPKKKETRREENIDPLEFCRSIDPSCEEPDGSVAKYDSALKVFKEEGASANAQLMIDLAFIHNIWVKLFLLEIVDVDDETLKSESDEYIGKAVAYVRERKHAWDETPGAMRWLVHTFARDMFEWASFSGTT
jgi:hypothetical protein